MVLICNLTAGGCLQLVRCRYCLDNTQPDHPTFLHGRSSIRGLHLPWEFRRKSWHCFLCCGRRFDSCQPYSGLHGWTNGQVQGTLSRSGGFYDKATDHLQVFVWFGAIAYAGYMQTQSDVTPIFLAFIGVCFYALRGYVKYVAIHSKMERDKEYLTEISRASAALQKQLDEFGGLDKGLGNNLMWFLKEQRKLFNFDEGVFVFMLSLALISPSTLIPMLWVFAVSQIFLGIIRCCQRGQQLAHDQHSDSLKVPDK